MDALLTTSRAAERDAAETRDRLALLQKLVGAFAAMASAFDGDDIARCLLRATRAPIGFDRVMWLQVDDAEIVVMKWLLDGSDALEPCDEVLDYERTDRLAAVIESRVATFGGPGELGAPIVDVRTWYALIPVSIQDEVRAVVYADGHRTSVDRAWYVDLVTSLSAVASIAIEKATIVHNLETLASRDPLTGLFNRRAFSERTLERIAAGRGAFAFAIFDVDDFKAVNDSRGHAAGDTMLKRLARTLLACSRAEDLVGRFAGDEFVMLIDGVAGREADAMLERISASIRTAGISCSIGASRYPAEATEIEALFAVADRALYAAKARGKNGFAISPIRTTA